ncbi:PARP-domain-containing protein [Obba rivulosa]|uniref:Poly [ADP-ribose] polymerase n=1 Tax=Obba rivulosa TaxID=1052685 RepID=A0A8E2AQL2_9APHY|nr:PARP-domain-containing protein [Obba rivulosa]
MPRAKKAPSAAATAAGDGAAANGADAAPARATRSSARNKVAAAATDASNGAASTSDGAAATTTAPTAPRAAKAPASKAKPKSKGKGKRARADVDDADADDAPDAKKTKADDDDDVAKKPVSGAKADGKKKADDKDDDQPKKMVTVLKRGAAPVDPGSGVVDTHQVLTTVDGVWDAALNQTNVGANANKFYIIQILHPIGVTGSCTLFTRWGRVGENGQSQRKGPFDSFQAINEFKKQFKAKAGVAWEQRHGMIAKSGKYQWIERVFEDEEDDRDKKASGSGDTDELEEEKIPDSTLDSEIQVLLNLMFSSKLMDAHLSSMNYDANKLPLGKLAKSTILNGFASLKILSEVISQPDGDVAKQHGGFQRACQELTGRYYSIIPHVFGRNRPRVISDLVTLKKELELVDALGDMEVASKLIQDAIPRDAAGNPMNPLDAHFRSLELSKMEPIARASGEFSALETYARDTHGATHHFQVQILHAYRVERDFETKAWCEKGFDKLPEGERMLLWHGSRTTNFAGILKQGLRIAPPEAPVTGYMFGKGVYFADMMSKSAGYCYAHLSDKVGLLLLCEVAAKPFYERHDAEYDADVSCKAAGKRATKGLGCVQPVEWQDAGEALGNDALRGCHMPKGPGQDVKDPQGYLQYNEYIVYDTAQIRLRYLLMVKMG